MDVVIGGRYRHFKGGIYVVEGIARHSETLESMVIYRSEKDPESRWVRPLSMWNEMVMRDGVSVARFTQIEEPVGKEEKTCR